MKPSIIVHNDCDFNSVEFVKLAGIINSISPNTDVVDASQYFEKDDVIKVGAYLFTTVPFWPEGSVFLSLVGKGKPIAVVLNNNNIIITRDNGTVSMCDDNIGIKKVYKLNEEYAEDDYAMAKACADLINADSDLFVIGETINKEDIKIFIMPETIISDGKACGAIGMLLKTFGNITFTIKTEDFEKTGIKKDDLLDVSITKDGKVVYHEKMTYQPSFGYVEVGEPLIFNGSSGYMDIGLNQKSFINERLPELLESEDITEYKVSIERIDK